MSIAGGYHHCLAFSDFCFVADCSCSVQQIVGLNVFGFIITYCSFDSLNPNEHSPLDCAVDAFHDLDELVGS